MISVDDFKNDMWVGPDIWVPPGVADFLISRMQWIREGEEADFQVVAPKGFDFDDLATLAYLIVTDDLVSAKVLADNLPRSLWMETSSSSMVEENLNYNFKNPFRRRRGKKRRLRGKSGSMENDPLLGDGEPKQDFLSGDEGDGSKDVDDGFRADDDDRKEADYGDGDDGNSSKGGGDSSGHGGNSSDPVANSPGGGIPQQDPPGKDDNANQDLLNGDAGDVSKDDDENRSKDGDNSDDDGSKDADDNGGSKRGSVSGAVSGGNGEGKRANKSKTTKTKKKRNEQFSRIIIPTLDRYAQV